MMFRFLARVRGVAVTIPVSTNCRFRQVSSSRWCSTTASGEAALPPLVDKIEDASAASVQERNKDGLRIALKPREVVAALDQFIVGQTDAKKAVAIALRNRWRRHQLGDDMRNEVIPKNILMIGPTGCGKTEIARRIAKLCQAPFIKVEATKFTEVGFHGKDVDAIIRDLLDISINMTKKRIKEETKLDAAEAVENKLLESLLGAHADEATRTSFRSLLREGSLEDRIIDVEMPPHARGGGGGPGGAIAIDVGNPMALVSEIAKLAGQQQGAGGNKLGGGKGSSSSKTEKKRMTIAEARPLVEEVEVERLLEDFDVHKEAIRSVEQSGIVFIDEIDKLISAGDHRSADASSEGVQRDLLPLIEGSTISTKHGNVNTDFILFIASGAFHSSKPSDLLAELQGRLPIRVSLKGLSEDDLYRILTEPVTNLIRQQQELLKTENVSLTFTDAAVRQIARTAFKANKEVENIGARRLHAVVERVVEDISFDAPELAAEKAGTEHGASVEVTAEFVEQRVAELLKATDLRKYII